MGLRVVICRLTIESLGTSTGPQIDVALQQARQACAELFAYAATLGPEAHEAWSPCEFHSSPS